MQGITPTPTRLAGFIGIVVVAVLASATLLTSGASPDAQATPREIRLVVRDMTFYLDGDDTPNPTLRFRAGERVRLVLRNEDTGMDHDFAIESWQVATRLLEGRGHDAVTFRVPETPGPQTYICTPHAQMMRGSIVVE